MKQLVPALSVVLLLTSALISIGFWAGGSMLEPQRAAPQGLTTSVKPLGQLG